MAVHVVVAPRKIVHVEDFGGQAYDVRVPKVILTMHLGLAAADAEKDPGALLKALNVWVLQAFGKTDGPKILARLDDDDDDLDLGHIMELMSQITEEGSGNPTGLSSD